MILPSFKLKIVLLNVLLSGFLLLGFGLFFIQMSYRIGIDRTDRELRALVEGEMQKNQPPNHWIRFDAALENLYGDTGSKQFLMNVIDYRNKSLFQSKQWDDFIGEAVIPYPPVVEPVDGEITDPAFTMRTVKRPRPLLHVSEPVFSTVGEWRIMTIRNPEITLALGISLGPLDMEIARARTTLMLTVPVALLLTIGVGWLLAQTALRPVNTIARTAQKVSALNLAERIPLTKADIEFRQLIKIINDMLDRLQSSFQQATRFSADAAHELKTPLTILSGELEAALQSAPDGSEDQQTYKNSLDEVQRLKSIIRKLLLFSQADSGKLPLYMEPLDLTELIRSTCGDIHLLNPEIKVEVDLQDGIEVNGDADLLSQVIQNLAGNAVKFSRGVSPITIVLRQDGDQVVFEISNRGVTIPDADRDKIFERFYRTDKARSRVIDGAGLGLSLAREIVQAHGGQLVLTDSSNSLTTFRLTLRCTGLPA